MPSYINHIYVKGSDPYVDMARIQSLLDELDTIEYYQQPGKAHHLSEITMKQCELYELMGVDVPA